MGTSKTRKSPSGMTSSSRAAGRFASGGSSGRSAFGKYVADLGGGLRAGSVAGGGAAGGGGGGAFASAPRAASTFGGLLGSIAQEGLETALRKAGLADLIGKSPLDVVAGIIQHCAGEGVTLADSIIRTAELLVLQDLLQTLPDDFEDLATDLQEKLSPEGVLELTANVLAEIALQSFLSDKAEAIMKAASSSEALAQREHELRGYLRELIGLRIAQAGLGLDDIASGSADAMIREAYQAALAEIEESD